MLFNSYHILLFIKKLLSFKNKQLNANTTDKWLRVQYELWEEGIIELKREHMFSTTNDFVSAAKKEDKHAHEMFLKESDIFHVLLWIEG